MEEDEERAKTTSSIEKSIRLLQLTVVTTKGLQVMPLKLAHKEDTAIVFFSLSTSTVLSVVEEQDTQARITHNKTISPANIPKLREVLLLEKLKPRPPFWAWRRSHLHVPIKQQERRKSQTCNKPEVQGA